MHEKRAQKLRVDEFSIQKVGESHDTMQRLTSQMQELQEMANCMDDSGKCQKESNYSLKISHVPSQRAVIPSPTWHMDFFLNTVKRFWQSTSYVRFITDTLSRNSSLYDPSARGAIPVQVYACETCRREWGTKKSHSFSYFNVFHSVRKEDVRKLANSERKDQHVHLFLETAESKDRRKSSRRRISRAVCGRIILPIRRKMEQLATALDPWNTKKTSHEELAEVLAADVDSSLGIWHQFVKLAMELLKSTPTWECWIAARWTEDGTFA